jgi:hypothetical protein
MALRSGMGARPRTLGALIHALRDDAGGLFPVWIAGLAIPGFVVGFRDRRTRWAIAVSLVTVAVWVVGLRDGAVIHDYWPYWVVLPLALAFGAGLDLLLTSVPRLGTVGAKAFVVVVAAVLGTVGLTMSVPAGQAQAAGSHAGALLRATHWPRTQQDAWVVGGGHVALDWASYYAHRRAADLASVSELEGLARERPDDLVLVVPGAPAGPGRPCTIKIRRGSTYALIPASDAVRGLDGDVVRPC